MWVTVLVCRNPQREEPLSLPSFLPFLNASGCLPKAVSMPQNRDMVETSDQETSTECTSGCAQGCGPGDTTGATVYAVCRALVARKTFQKKSPNITKKWPRQPQIRKQGTGEHGARVPGFVVHKLPNWKESTSKN